MARKNFKRGQGKFIQFDHYIYDSTAWQALKPGPRALYLEMKRRYNGFNNGELFLSQRDAAKALNVGRDTVELYRRELVAKGFLVKTRGHHLGAAGIGQAALWALTEYSVGTAKPTYSFKAWKK